MPSAEVDGRTIASDDSGGEREPGIRAHGFPIIRTMLAPQVEAPAAESSSR